MKLAPVQRAILLAFVALGAVLVVLAISDKFERSSSRTASSSQPVPVPGSSWHTVQAGVIPARSNGERTACGVVLTPSTYGVAHPSLPCGARIFIAYGNTQVLTQVIDHGPYVPGRELDLTRRLADRLGLRGLDRVRWRFAR